MGGLPCSVFSGFHSWSHSLTSMLHSGKWLDLRYRLGKSMGSGVCIPRLKSHFPHLPSLCFIFLISEGENERDPFHIMS